jgi:ADP-ribose diphosphatase
VPRGDGPAVWAAPEVGDGSPLEEGADLRWRPLADAIAACERGDIEDAKTEIALRRLAARVL